MKCNLCGKTSFDVIDHMVFELLGEDHKTDVVTCKSCGYTFLSSPPPPAVLEEYYRHQNRQQQETVAYDEQVDMIVRTTKVTGAAVLDIGAYDGRLLGKLVRAGAKRIYGVEPDTTVKPVVSYTNIHTLDTAVGILKDLDLITMGHTLEHLRDPRRVIETAIAILKPGGTMFIEVPDLDDPQVQVVPYWTPYHVSYFNTGTLTYLLEDVGMKVVAVEKTGYRAIRMVARKIAPDGVRFTAPIPSTGAIEKYYRERGALLHRIDKTIGELMDRDTAVFGAGEHTKWLLRIFPQLALTTTCILDSDSLKQGTTMCGIPVFKAEDCPDKVTHIIVSSYDSQPEIIPIVLGMGKTPVYFYDEVRAYDVWKGEGNAKV